MEGTNRTGTMRFGAFEVDLRSGEVYKHGIRLKLQGQPFQVLARSYLSIRATSLRARNFAKNSGLRRYLC